MCFKKIMLYFPICFFKKKFKLNFWDIHFKRKKLEL